MGQCIHHFVKYQAAIRPDATAVAHGDTSYSYQVIWENISQLAAGLQGLGLNPGDRVAILLPTSFEAICSIFACSAAGLIFVPINPILRPDQVIHIIRHSGASALISTNERLSRLGDLETRCPGLQYVISAPSRSNQPHQFRSLTTIPWHDLLTAKWTEQDIHQGALAALIYTSGSTGLPKGVMLSHGNLATGASSVVQYLGNHEQDRLLALLPFSFDYGLSQLTTAFLSGAAVVLIDYLVPNDVVRATEKYGITGIAAIPSLWISLSRLDWPSRASDSIRYITSSGGVMQPQVTRQLAARLPGAQIFLMYGLTEAFRSTYLSPDLVEQFPESIGRAIPQAEICVVNEAGDECAPMETGELVHMGPLVAQGYWQDEAAGAKCFRSAPGFLKDPNQPAVWSGDQVYRDPQGLLYFVGRKDLLIKTSGYRVSPYEIESVLHQQTRLSDIDEIIALGVPHPDLGQAIVLVMVADQDQRILDDIMRVCREGLANYMQPQDIIFRHHLPQTANGKTDRVSLGSEYQYLFQPDQSHE